MGGWQLVTRSAYLWGLALTAAGGSLMVFIALPVLRRMVRLVLCLVLVTAVIGLGVWLPHRQLDAAFAGMNVQWSIPSADPEDEFVVALLGGPDIAVLADQSSARLISLADGHQINKIPATRDATFSVAGERLLVVQRGLAQLYDKEGKSLWSEVVHGDRGVAAGPGTTVLEAGDTAVAVADDGSIRWQRKVDAIRAESSRFPNVGDLPANNIYLTSGPPVLPSVAALPLPATKDEWDFVEPTTGRSVHRAAGEFAGSVGPALITSTFVDGLGCDVRIKGESTKPALLGCTYGKPWAVGSALFFENGADANVTRFRPDGGIAGRLSVRDVSLSTAKSNQDRALVVSDRAMASRDGRTVHGYPDLRYVDGWTFVAESEGLTLKVGQQSVVVIAALPRTNPFDNRSGFVPGDDTGDTDHRISVLDATTGAVTGSVRAHTVSSIRPVAPGRALVVADGNVLLLG